MDYKFDKLVKATSKQPEKKFKGYIEEGVGAENPLAAPFHRRVCIENKDDSTEKFCNSFGIDSKVDDVASGLKGILTQTPGKVYFNGSPEEGKKIEEFEAEGTEDFNNLRDYLSKREGEDMPYSINPLVDLGETCRTYSKDEYDNLKKYVNGRKK